MSKNNLLRNAIGAIESNKPLVLPKKQTFAPPSFQNPINKEVDPWGNSTLTTQKQEIKNTHQNKELQATLSDNRGPEIQAPQNQNPQLQGPDSKDTENQHPSNQELQINSPDHQSPENQSPENQKANPQEAPNRNSEALLFGRPPKKSEHRERAEGERKKKRKSITLKRKSATKDQMASFINPKTSKPQGFLPLSVGDTLEILLTSDPERALKGNEWPVLLFMSLKAYEWINDKKTRKDGKQNFATEYVARGTGISESTVFEVINRLIAKGYVKPIEGSTRGNIYHVSPILVYRPGSGGDPKGIDPSLTEAGENPTPSPSKLETPAPRKSDPVPSLSVNQPTENPSPGTPKIGEPVHLKSVTRVDRIDLIDLSLLEKHFEEIYFSKIRAPQVIEDEKRAFKSIVSRNGDILLEEFLECFEIVSRQKDFKGNPVIKKFVWMAGGLDSILKSARGSLREKQRKVEFSEAKPRIIVPGNPSLAEVEDSEESKEYPQPTEFSNPSDRKLRDEIQLQIETVSEELSRCENLYVIHLDEDHLSKMAALRKKREELYDCHRDLLSYDPIALWTVEISRIDALIQSIQHFHTQSPGLVTIGQRRLEAVRSEFENKIETLKQETSAIQAEIAKSLGLGDRHPAKLAFA